jgi:hypothetical protein
VSAPETSIRQRIIAAVVASPGITLRQIATTLGYGPRADVKSLGAQLSQLCTSGKMRRQTVHTPAAGRAVATGYWPTDTAQVDERQLKRKPGTEQERRAESKRRQRAARRESDAQKRARYTSNRATPPTEAQQFRIAEPPRPRAPATPANGRETVDEFLRRGGHIQALPTGYCPGSPLRFDHSGNHTRAQSARPCATKRNAPAAAR